MAVASVLYNNFTAGEVSPLLMARSDFERYKTGAKNLENWLVLLQGGLRTRFGTRFVCNAKYSTRLCRVMPFEATGVDAYILEVGHEYVRFCINEAQILVSEVPVEIETPYQEAELRGIRTAQANDVMLLVHGTHPPAQLTRISETAWSYKPIVFDPPPLYEAGLAPDATLTPSALTGNVTLTASAASFLQTDVDRVVQANDARVAITAYTSTTVVNGDVLSAFTSLAAVPAGSWKLERSPVAELKPSKDQPVGGRVYLDLRVAQPDATNMVTNGSFASGLTGWTNLSGPALTTGTHTGGSGATLDLTDSTQNFYNVGVQPGHLVFNSTDGSRGSVGALYGLTGLHIDDNEMRGGTLNNFTADDAYTVMGTGGAGVRNGKAYLAGNLIGMGWIEQALTTVSGQAYRVLFTVSEGAISAQIGSATGGSDLKEELLYDQGNDQEMIFVATGTTSYLQFRNNQPTAGAVGVVSTQPYSAAGWRATDVGKYVKVNDGLVKLTAYVSASRMQGTILRELADDEAIAGGAWKLLEPAWSDTRGWPSFLTFFEGRLYFTGVDGFPQDEWGSKVDDFFNFFEGPLASDAVHFKIVDSSGNITLNAIKWLAPGENLLAGTTHAEYRQTGPVNGAFSAIELPLVRLQSAFGSSDVQPIRVGQSLLFSQRQGSAIRRMAWDPDVASAFLAKDITALSGHLLKRSAVVEFAYQPEALPLVWAVRSDGVLLTLTIDQTEEVAGWAHHVTAGAFESIAPIPHPTANSYQLWTSVQRFVDGVETHTIEYFDDQATMSARVAIDGVIPTWQGLTLDSAVLYNFGNSTSATLTGLMHLAGEQVRVVGDGAVFPLQTVTPEGTVTLSVPVKLAWAGLPFTCTGETLPIETMLRSGTTHGHERNWLRLVVQLYESIGLKVNGQQMPFRSSGMPLGAGVPLFTGKYPLIAPSEWSLDSTLTFVQDQPLPATVLAVSGDLDIGGTG